MARADRTNDLSAGESSPLFGQLNIKVAAVACHLKIQIIKSNLIKSVLIWSWSCKDHTCVVVYREALTLDGHVSVNGLAPFSHQTLNMLSITPFNELIPSRHTEPLNSPKYPSRQLPDANVAYSELTNVYKLIKTRFSTFVWRSRAIFFHKHV